MYAQSFSGGGVTDNVWIMSGQDAYFKELTAGDNIGIGTTTPAHTLHVGGNAASAPALLVCDSGGQRIEVTGGAVKINNAYTLPAADGSAGQVICTDGSDTLTFGPGGYWTCAAGPELYYTGGDVGIGTTAPDGSLHVMSASAGTITADANADELVIEGSGNAGLTILSANTSQGNIAFGDDGNAKQGIFGFHQGNAEFNWSQATQQMVLDSSGKLGIGTATPSHLLDVEGVAHAATCIVTPQVCGTTQVTGAIVCASTELRGALICSAGGNVCSCIVTATDHASACMRSCHYCALGTIGTPELSVSLAPTGTNHVTPKCYVDAQITANAKGVCLVQNKNMEISGGTCIFSCSITQISETKTFITYAASYITGTGNNECMVAHMMGNPYLACSGQCVVVCRQYGTCSLFARLSIVTSY